MCAELAIQVQVMFFGELSACILLENSDQTQIMQYSAATKVPRRVFLVAKIVNYSVSVCMLCGLHKVIKFAWHIYVVQLATYVVLKHRLYVKQNNKPWKVKAERTLLPLCFVYLHCSLLYILIKINYY